MYGVLCPICNPERNPQTSIETIMKDILDKLNIEYIQHDRKLIGPKELDFYLNNYIADYDNEIINFIGKDTKQVKQIPELPKVTCKNMMQIYDRIYDICNTATYRKYRNILLKQLRSNYAVF